MRAALSFIFLLFLTGLAVQPCSGIDPWDYSRDFGGQFPWNNWCYDRVWYETSSDPIGSTYTCIPLTSPGWGSNRGTSTADRMRSYCIIMKSSQDKVTSTRCFQAYDWCTDTRRCAPVGDVIRSPPVVTTKTSTIRYIGPCSTCSNK
ncbi:MAG: hypothetical protein MUO26_10340 [Methanotrichaceae archaeon]|nr:hypothetical protein [Methanotrichaceae archaeon]